VWSRKHALESEKKTSRQQKSPQTPSNSTRFPSNFSTLRTSWNLYGTPYRQVLWADWVALWWASFLAVWALLLQVREIRNFSIRPLRRKVSPEEHHSRKLTRSTYSLIYIRGCLRTTCFLHIYSDFWMLRCSHTSVVPQSSQCPNKCLPEESKKSRQVSACSKGSSYWVRIVPCVRFWATTGCQETSSQKHSVLQQHVNTVAYCW
jgi:hypothetical protein